MKVILSTWVLLSKRMGRSIVMSTIGSKPTGWDGGEQQEFYATVTFRYGWRESFIGLVLSQLCYNGTKYWAIKRYHAQKLSVAEMSMLRWMCGNTRRDEVRNENIHTKIGVATIKEKMRENHLRWFGHVRRRATDAQLPVHRIEGIKLGQVKRAQGIPKKTWMEVIRQEAKGLSEGILLDRNKWRKLIHVPDPV